MNSKLNTPRRHRYRAFMLMALISLASLASSQLQADTTSVSIPFTDVDSGNLFFPAIAGAYFSGLTNGTSATTYTPAANVPREQMAAFVSRTLDQSLKRGSPRAALGQFWTPQDSDEIRRTTLGFGLQQVKSDGEDLWVANVNGTVSRVRASDGKVLGIWTGADGAREVLVARGRIYILCRMFPDTMTPGSLYSLDPSQPPGPVTLVTNALGNDPDAMTYDGSRIWTANADSVSMVSFSQIGPLVTTVTSGFTNLSGILYDGANIWVTDRDNNTLKKLNADGSIAQSIFVGTRPEYPVFDGTNIWVPNFGAPSAVRVVRAATGQSIANLTGNGLNGPLIAAFDGERILVTNFVGDSVSLWKAADLSPLGSVSLLRSGTSFAETWGACSDGVNFWLTLRESTGGYLARF